jgi:hypothetical protein
MVTAEICSNVMTGTTVSNIAIGMIAASATIYIITTNIPTTVATNITVAIASNNNIADISTNITCITTSTVTIVSIVFTRV